MAVLSSTSSLRGYFSAGEPMHKHCSWRTGGPAEHYFEPADLDDLVAYLKLLDALEPITWVGLGSNVLIRDGGIAGSVISTAKGLNQWQWVDEHKIRTKCGVACAKVAREVARRGLQGAEFLSGIPGTIGGGLAMNAGAFGAEIWQFVNTARVVDRAGLIHTVHAGDYQVGYRSVALPAEHWFVDAELSFRRSQDFDGGAEIRSLLQARADSQPTGVASCGSVFKNPEGDHAGRLIEAAGLKGYRHGGCSVSTKHANFIINEQDASSADIETLIELIQAVVRERFGVLLETEVRIIGDKPLIPGRAN